MKANLKKILFSVVIVVLLTMVSSLSFASDVTIKAGTPIPVKLEEAISSETATAGQTVRFTVTRNVSVDGTVVIKAGSPVVGEITYSQKTGSLGKEGKVFLVLQHAVAVDGTRVPLDASLSQSGDEQVALSYMICPFIKGTSSMIPAGTETKAYVEYDTKISL